MEAIGVFIIACTVIILILWYRNDGILCLFNFGRVGFIIWMLGLGLYDLRLTKLYNPNLLINCVALLIAANFAVVSYVLPLDIKKFAQCCYEVRTEKSYSLMVCMTLALGVISFIVNYRAGVLRFFMSNTAIKTSVRLSYFLGLMVVVSFYFYVMARISKKKGKKILNYGLSGFSLFLIFCNMSRGPLMFWLTGVFMFEVCRYAKKKNRKYFSWKQIMATGFLAVFFFWMFGAVGDFRTASVFKDGASSFYQMKNNYPSGVTWIYIYLTSPFENARYAISSIDMKHYSFFNKLFYPFFKFFANLIGQGEQYAQYVNGFRDVSSCLEPQYGLNVGSFILDAYSDFGILGILMYMFWYNIVAFLTHKILCSKKIDNTSKAIIFPVIVQIAIWSVFSNSLFQIAGIWIDILFVLIWNKVAEYKIRI